MLRASAHAAAPRQGPRHPPERSGQLLSVALGLTEITLRLGVVDPGVLRAQVTVSAVCQRAARVEQRNARRAELAKVTQPLLVTLARTKGPVCESFAVAAWVSAPAGLDCTRAKIVVHG